MIALRAAGHLLAHSAPPLASVTGANATMGPSQLLALVLAALPAGVCADQIFRWVGTDGVVHYSEHPPPGVQAEPVSVRSGSSNPEQAASELKRLREKAGLGGEPGAAGGTAAPAGPSPEQQAELDRQREENCRNAQENLRVLESAQRVMSRDAEGNLVRLDDDQKRARLSETHRQIEQYCGPRP
jgi:hypothetical protein